MANSVMPAYRRLRRAALVAGAALATVGCAEPLEFADGTIPVPEGHLDADSARWHT